MPLAVSCDRVRCLAKTRHLNPTVPAVNSNQPPVLFMNKKRKVNCPPVPFSTDAPSLLFIGYIQPLNAQLADLTPVLGTSDSG